MYLGFLPPEIEARSTVICLQESSINYCFVKSKFGYNVVCWGHLLDSEVLLVV